MNVSTQSSLMDVIAGHELVENLAILGREEDLDHILMVAKNFATSADLSATQKNLTLDPANIDLASKVLDYTCELLAKYEEAADEILFNTLDILQNLSFEDKKQYLDKFSMLVNMDTKTSGSYVLPLLSAEIMERLTYEIPTRYETDAFKLKEDIDRVVGYTIKKMEQNARHNIHAFDIEYEACFPEKNKIKMKGNGQITPDDILEHINSGKAPDEFILAYGMPVGIAVKGLRNGLKKTMVIYFGDNTMQHGLHVVHQHGLDRKSTEFYKGLAQVVKPVDSLRVDTIKTIHHLQYC